MSQEREVLTLKCVRCGDTHQREVGDPYTPELCSSCFSKGLELLFAEEWPHPKYERWTTRWQRNSQGHPTTAMLKAAWERYTSDWPDEYAGDDGPF